MFFVFMGFILRDTTQSEIRIQQVLIRPKKISLLAFAVAYSRCPDALLTERTSPHFIAEPGVLAGLFSRLR